MACFGEWQERRSADFFRHRDREPGWRFDWSSISCFYRSRAYGDQSRICSRVDIRISDHATFSGRVGALTILPKRIGREEPLHLLVAA
jgi:hypothetical protein